MNIIEKFIKVLERYMDNLSIKKKFIQLYIFCVLLPLIITDSVVLYIEDSMESQRQYHEMANVANAVSYNISALVENAGEIAKSMYTDRRMNTFLEKQYESTSDYYAEYQNFFQDSTLENVLGMNQIVFTKVRLLLLSSPVSTELTRKAIGLSLPVLPSPAVAARLLLMTVCPCSVLLQWGCLQPKD